MNPPLQGIRVLVTRASTQGERFAEKLRALGATVYHEPLIAITTPDSWDKLDECLNKITIYDWILFASANAVRSVCERAKHLKISLKNSRTSLATIGPATSTALEEYGYHAAFSPSEFIGEGLIESFPAYEALKGKRILWPRTNIGRNIIAERLQEAGATVEIVQCYKTVLPSDADEIGKRIVKRIEQNDLDIITVASSQTARNLAMVLREAAPQHLISDLLQNVSIVCIGPETLKTAKELLTTQKISQAPEYTTDGLIAAITALVG